MGKQTKSKKSEKVIGKGKVTPVQVAFIVDRYLSDNNFVQSRSTFRTEASLLIPKSAIHEAPKSLLTLGDMLDEYICLKEQKVILNQEKTRLEQEKFRVQTLLRGMQDVMNAYNNVGGAVAADSLPRPPMPMPMVQVPHTDPNMVSAAVSYPAYDTPVMMAASRPSNTQSDATNFSTPTTSLPTLKRRKNAKDVSCAPLASKRSRSHPSAKLSQASDTTHSLPQPSNASNNQETALELTTVPSTSHASAHAGSSTVHGSTVAKCLFNQNSHTPGPQTPSPSTIDKSVSPLENHTPPLSSTATVMPPQFTSTNCTLITSETIKVSPSKKVSYYTIERNHCISSPIKSNTKRFCKRDHVKGRLDFDGSDKVAINSVISTSDGNNELPSEKEEEAFDFDLPSLDCLGMDFNLTELLDDFDLDGQRLEYFCQPASGSSPESLSGSGSPDTPGDGNIGDHELLSGISSTLTEFRSEQDMNMPGNGSAFPWNRSPQGPNSFTTVKSITKCIKVFSPAKNQKNSGSDQDTSSVRLIS